MELKNSLLVIRQLDKKLKGAYAPSEALQPAEGWVNLIRKTLRMSLRQLANKMSITPQSLNNIEKREKEGTITLKKLREAAEGLDMKLVYVLIPKDGSLEKMIERKASEQAKKIVLRTSATMKLEDQGNSTERIAQAIAEMTEEIKRELPKSLWD